MDTPKKTPQEWREAIVLAAMDLQQDDPEALDAFDRLACGALGVDPDEDPAHFIFDALYSAS